MYIIFKVTFTALNLSGYDFKTKVNKDLCNYQIKMLNECNVEDVPSHFA